MESTQTRIIEPSAADNLTAKKGSDNREGLKRGVFIVAASGITATVAGLVTTHYAKKSGRENLRELQKKPELVLESPHALALRALAWGTLLAVGTFSISIFGLWKFFGLKDLDDLRARIRKHRKVSESEGRTEFESLSDFFNYINEESKKKSSANDT